MEENSLQVDNDNLKSSIADSPDPYRILLNAELKKTHLKIILYFFIYSIPSLIFFLMGTFIDVSLLPFIGSPIIIFNKIFYPYISVNIAFQPVSLWWFLMFLFPIYFIVIAISTVVIYSELKNESGSESAFFSISYKVSAYIVNASWLFFLIAQILLLISFKENPGSFFAFCLPFSLKSFFTLLIAYSFRGHLLKQADIFTKTKIKLNNLKKK